MRIKISALDTLFFRDGKPFSMGEETWANGLFPPPPNVFYGALRSLYFSIFQDEFSRIEQEDKTENLIINQITPFINDKSRFPIPLDIVKKKETEDECCLLKMTANQFSSSYPLEKILTTSDWTEVVESMESKAYMLKRDFLKYLVNGSEYSVGRLKPEFQSDLIIEEPKVGIGRNNTTLTTDEGKLYRVGMKRLKTGDNVFDFVVDFEGLNFNSELPERGFLKLGAENKSVHYEVLTDSENLASETFQSNRFKLVLTSPAIFKNGWFPDFLDENYRGKFEGFSVKLIAAITGKSISIGGFDMKKRKPKPMFKTVPAGSVFYFEVEEGLKDFVVKEVKLTCLNNLDKEGFGHAFIGKV
jgi:CRISPR-associated protein Cmr3